MYDRYMTLFAVDYSRFSIGRIPYHPFDEDGYVLSEDETTKCARDSPKAFKLLYELGKIKRASITRVHFNLVVATGDVSILTWFRSIGISWDGHSCRIAIEHGKLEVVKWLNSMGCCMMLAVYLACDLNQLDILKWVHRNVRVCGLLGSDSYFVACQKGHTRVLKWLCENWVHAHEDGCFVACVHGHLDIVEFLIQRGVVLDIVQMQTACKRGYIEIVKRLHLAGGPWNESSMKFACKFGHIDLVKWMHENGCPSDGRAIAYALEHNHMNIVEYLVDTGLTWNPDTDIDSDWSECDSDSDVLADLDVEW